MKILRKTASFVALMAMGSMASAASLTYQGAVFTSTVTGSGSNYQLTMTMDFTGADPGNEFLGDMMESWSLTIGSPATLALVSAPAPLAGWALQSNAQSDASGCGNGNVNTVCVDWGDLNVLNGGGPLITDADIFTFVVDLTFAAPTDFLGNGNFHLLSVREVDCKRNIVGPCYKKDGGLISQPLVVGDDDDDDDDDTDMPEPGTLALLGLGLLGLGMSRRRKA